MNVNVVEELINSLNKIDIDENNDNLYQKEELSEDEELNAINDDIEDNHINNKNDKKAYEQNDRKIEEGEGEQNESNNEKGINEKNPNNNNISSLYGRLLSDKRFLKYQELIKEIKNSSYKIDTMPDDEDIMEVSINQKKKIKYPKNK